MLVALQVYNEACRDLLCPKGAPGATKLEVGWSAGRRRWAWPELGLAILGWA